MVGNSANIFKPATVSRTQMRKRLSRAGYRGEELRKVLAQIAELQRAVKPTGKIVMGCSAESLSDLVGKAAYRKLTAWPVETFLAVAPSDDFFFLTKFGG